MTRKNNARTRLKPLYGRVSNSLIIVVIISLALLLIFSNSVIRNENKPHTVTKVVTISKNITNSTNTLTSDSLTNTRGSGTTITEVKSTTSTKTPQTTILSKTLTKRQELSKPGTFMSKIVTPDTKKARFGSVEITFMKGSIKKKVNITVGLILKQVSEEFGTTMVYVINAPENALEGFVEIRFHYDSKLIPSTMERSVNVGYFDNRGKYHQVEAVVDTQQDVIVVKTNHFSVWVINWPSRGLESWRPPSEQKILEVPYYAQSSTGYCWAASLAMITEYYDNDELFFKPWDIAAIYGIRTSEGISSLEFWLGTTTSDYVEALFGIKPERHIWFPAISVKKISRYIISSIRNGDPVAIFLKDHVVVITGFYSDGKRVYYYIHDPADPVKGINKKVSQSSFFSSLGGAEAVFTLVVPLHGSKRQKPPVTITVPSGVRSQREIIGITLMPPEGRLEPTNTYRVIWNGTYKKGYYLAIEKRVGKRLVLMKGAAPDTYDLQIGFGVANTAHKPLRVRIDVLVSFTHIGENNYRKISSTITTIEPGKYMELKTNRITIYNYEIIFGGSLPNKKTIMIITIVVSDLSGREVYDETSISVPLRPWSSLSKKEFQTRLFQVLNLSQQDYLEYRFRGSSTDSSALAIVEAKRLVQTEKWDQCPNFNEDYEVSKIYSKIKIVIANSIYKVNLEKIAKKYASMIPDMYYDIRFATGSICVKEKINVSDPTIIKQRIEGGEAYIIKALVIEKLANTKTRPYPSKIYKAEITITIWSKGDVDVIIVSTIPILKSYSEQPIPSAENALKAIINMLEQRDLLES